MTDRVRNSSRLAALLAMAMILAGCSPMSLNREAAQTPDEFIAVAQDMGDPVEAQRYLLKTADQLQGEGRHKEARTLLQSEPLTPPEPSLRAQYLLLAMAGAVALEDRDWARQIADGLGIDQYSQYREDLVPQAARLQVEIFRLARQPLQAAMTLISTPSGLVLPADERSDRIWQLLKRVPASRIRQQGEQAIGYDTQGWFELALMLRQPGISLEQQGKSIRQWQQNWSDHPAASQLPSELSLITRLSQERPEKIALALPLSGPLASVGAAVRDGFMAAFYSDPSAADYDITITVTDTHEQVFGNLYDELRKDNPDLIVGPLEKESLASVMQRDAMPVPLLALNYHDQPGEPPRDLYQFGLSAEDEARQIARRLQQEGQEQVLVLIPEGDWGNRVEQALREALGQRGGVALDVRRFFRDDNLRAVTADLLGINTSRDRAIAIERTIGQNVEFEPRRRQDVDAIVMVAQPNVARQFKPLFAFYFGGDLPVYSPSIIYEGRTDPSRDRDLDKVRFTDIPWVLQPDNPLRQDAIQAFPNMGAQLGRLFAMGVDAYRLSKRLPLLRQVEGSSVQGLTGRLTMGPEGRVQREQMWAIFEQGTPRVLPETEPTPAGETDEPASSVNDRQQDSQTL